MTEEVFRATLAEIRAMYMEEADSEIRELLLLQLDIGEQKRAQTRGLTEEELQERQSFIARRAIQVRRTAWVKWLRRRSWTVEQAGHLVDGRDPDVPISGYETAAEAVRRITRESEKMIAMRVGADTTPLVPATDITSAEYDPLVLIAFALENRVGYACELLHFLGGVVQKWAMRPNACFKSIEDSRTTKRAQFTVERAEYVSECARVAAEIAPDAPVTEILVPMQTEAFLAFLQQQLRGRPTRLAVMTPDTLERARLDRDGLEHLPRIYLQVGPPSSPNP